MRKLLSVLAAAMLLATCNVQDALAATVMYISTMDGNGTITGDLNGSLIAHNTYSTLTLTGPALTAADIVGTFGGTCSATTVLLGSGNCGAAGVSNVTFSMPSGFIVSGSPCVSGSSCVLSVTTALNGVVVANGSGFGVATGTCNSSTFVTGAGSCAAVSASQVTSSFTGTCNSSTYLSGNGSCTAPIITALSPSDTTRTAGALQPDANLTFTLGAGSYDFQCMLIWIGNTSGATFSGGFGNNGSSTNTYWTGTLVPLTGNPSSVSYVQGSNGNNPAGNSATINATLTGETVTGTIKFASTNTFALNWTEGAAGDSLTLKAGSWCTVVKIG